MNQDKHDWLYRHPGTAALMRNRQSSSVEEDDIVLDLECCRGSHVSALTTRTKRVPLLKQNPADKRVTFIDYLHHQNINDVGADVGKQPPMKTLHGRQNELDLMLRAYSCTCSAELSDKKSSQVVLLHGPSGCGKSSLAESLRCPISQQGGYFVSGEFNSGCKLPYSALVEALTDLCDLIAQRKGFGKPQQEKIRQKIGPAETRRLGVLMGNLHRITGDDLRTHDGSKDDFDGNDNDAVSLVRRCDFLLHSFKKFLRATSSPRHPICIFLDDLQFADPLSLQLLHGLAVDSMSHNIMFLFVFRSDVDDVQLQGHLLSGLKQVTIVDIKLPNLTVEALRNVIADDLTIPSSSVAPLARVVLRKTRGQPSGALQYLSILRRDGLITKSPTGSWLWDVAQIQSKTDVTDYVADIVFRKINKCHHHVQFVLKVASAIGCEFDRRLLEKVIMIQCFEASAGKHNSTIAYDDQNIHTFLNDAAKEGLVEKSGYSGQFLNTALKDGFIEKTGCSGKLKFSHRRIWDAFYSMFPEGQSREELHFCIGLCVHGMLQRYRDAEPPEWMIFSTAEQVNRAGKWRDPIEQVQINLQASRFAQVRGLFQAAADFLRSAQLVFSPKTLFSAHYELGRDLYSEVTDVEFALGDFAKAEAAARLLCMYAKCPKEKLGAFEILVDSMDAQGRRDDSVHSTLSLLDELGEDFPSNPKAIQVIVELMKTQQTLRNMSDKEILDIPEMKDESKLNIVKVMSLLGNLTAFSGFELITLLSTLRIIQRSLRYGMTYISTYAFANFGKTMAITGHPDEAYRIGNVALEILKEFDTPLCIHAHTIVLVHGSCRHWKEPFQESLQPLKEAYERSISVGDIKFSLLSAQNYLVGSLESGIALPQVEVDMRTFCEGLDDISLAVNSAFRTMILPFWQLVLNLMGLSEDTLLLKGAAMDEDSFLRDGKAEKFAGGMMAYTKAKFMLAYYFDDLKSAEQLAEHVEQEERAVCSHFTIYQLKMICCLTYLHVFEKTGQWNYYMKAIKIIEKLESWMDQGNVNCRPILSLLRAEEASLKTSKEHPPVAFKHDFDSAIVEAKGAGLTHIEALGLERAAVACFRFGDNPRGVSYIARACHVYKEWGAIAKADHLERKFLMASECISPLRLQSNDEQLSIGSIHVRTITP